MSWLNSNIPARKWLPPMLGIPVMILCWNLQPSRPPAPVTISAAEHDRVYSRAHPALLDQFDKEFLEGPTCDFSSDGKLARCTEIGHEGLFQDQAVVFLHKIGDDWTVTRSRLCKTAMCEAAELIESEQASR
jgi:hypothetical protein